ncbi:MAG: DUF3592 domain-containing protein [Planctomycetes bacterium]|nr:DUF3592 domain-containing protein [Planctomycetota bacterium]MBL7044804.1 DUF3592 domain-containing protein [Pirellulaceae bacterium]
MNEPLLCSCLVFSLLALGIVLVLIGSLRIKKALVMTDWALVPGRILSSELRRHWAGAEAAAVQYKPKIEYEYEVEEKMYLGKRWTYRYTGLSKRAAQDVVNRYPVGKCVGVFHDPRNPKDAVLERGGAGFGTVLVLCGIVVLTLGEICLRHID